MGIGVDTGGLSMGYIYFPDEWGTESHSENAVLNFADKVTFT